MCCTRTVFVSFAPGHILPAAAVLRVGRGHDRLHGGSESVPARARVRRMAPLSRDCVPRRRRRRRRRRVHARVLVLALPPRARARSRCRPRGFFLRPRRQALQPLTSGRLRPPSAPFSLHSFRCRAHRQRFISSVSASFVRCARRVPGKRSVASVRRDGSASLTTTPSSPVHSSSITHTGAWSSSSSSAAGVWLPSAASSSAAASRAHASILVAGSLPSASLSRTSAPAPAGGTPAGGSASTRALRKGAHACSGQLRTSRNHARPKVR
mmetsp:Transcript_20552/g.66689  ORF Transcript_20552/g.66689 Transcript_20552/m.66689 type:complete len:268 (+) Transcript_20552:25-828(+)